MQSDDQALLGSTTVVICYGDRKRMSQLSNLRREFTSLNWDLDDWWESGFKHLDVNEKSKNLKKVEAQFKEMETVLKEIEDPGLILDQTKQLKQLEAELVVMREALDVAIKAQKESPLTWSWLFSVLRGEHKGHANRGTDDNYRSNLLQLAELRKTRVKDDARRLVDTLLRIVETAGYRDEVPGYAQKREDCLRLTEETGSRFDYDDFDTLPLSDKIDIRNQGLRYAFNCAIFEHRSIMNRPLCLVADIDGSLHTSIKRCEDIVLLRGYHKVMRRALEKITDSELKKDVSNRYAESRANLKKGVATLREWIASGE